MVCGVGSAAPQACPGLKACDGRAGGWRPGSKLESTASNGELHKPRPVLTSALQSGSRIPSSRTCLIPPRFAGRVPPAARGGSPGPGSPVTMDCTAVPPHRQGCVRLDRPHPRPSDRPSRAVAEEGRSRVGRQGCCGQDQSCEMCRSNRRKRGEGCCRRACNSGSEPCRPGGSRFAEPFRSARPAPTSTAQPDRPWPFHPDPSWPAIGR